jgi:hypothetical protein
VTGAPAGFKTAVQTAVQFFDTTFTSNISINIGFGWGEVSGHSLGSTSVAESSFTYGENFNYQQVRNALATADAGSPALATAVADLPTIDPTGGANFAISTADEKALGLYFGSSFAMDGYVGLSSSHAFTFDPNNRAVAGKYDAIGIIEHEISEVLGRSVFTSQAFSGGVLDGPLDLFRYSAANVHDFQQGAGAYFSLDNGVTPLKTFNDGNNGGDGGDWATSSQADSFDAYSQIGALEPVSLVDLQEMELLGYAGPAAILTGTAANNFTASFQGVFRQYTVGSGGATVAGGPEGANETLVNIHRVQFVDGYLAYSPTDTAGQVYRLYEATLNRAPDQEGLTNWTNSLNSGASLQNVANGFVASAEFQADYGNLDNTGFVTLLYQNVLHRAPDTSGLNSWVNALNSGQDTRAQVVVGFTESQEDINDLAAPVQQGLWVGNLFAAEVARLYDAVLARLPDSSGLANWVSALNAGTSLQTVAGDFVASAEFQTVYGSLDNTGFVTLLYENVLHRAPDTAGLSNWVTALSSGQDTRAQVVLGFSESPEHILNTAPHIDNGIWVTG